MNADYTNAERGGVLQKAGAKTMLALAALALLMLIFTRALATPSSVQLDPGGFNLIQNGGTVGEVFVPIYDPASTNYVEHWVLFKGYIYGGKDPSLVTTIVAGQNRYENEEDFFKRVPWGAGFRYVRVECTDTDRLPGR